MFFCIAICIPNVLTRSIKKTTKKQLRWRSLTKHASRRRCPRSLPSRSRSVCFRDRGPRLLCASWRYVLIIFEAKFPIFHSCLPSLAFDIQLIVLCRVCHIRCPCSIASSSYFSPRNTPSLPLRHVRLLTHSLPQFLTSLSRIILLCGSVMCIFLGVTRHD